ncbi:MAG: hypothetical protein A3D67_02830 [Candidatus Lloydbacteria bacterium RIFCSPHIGHO2_02_FULL_51_22]|uniref:Segregation and condensation protein A n=2 Tax=Candidatus Lloydiibacteriota TaxID=1817910 RepID=A0A1G2DGI6_9BACT|nr:MAG: hypothetical protein A3D67_02830 [Candidatus Lloydbacteria bacterium RIFCSPHIGHO2_02_FULL_51_22]OGZ14646.1 MAG: hypothetical protein A3J08_00970 [Candidatus Lloydbacteria bacterium RIFCSPLOWO2_02_FULL_51_11]
MESAGEYTVRTNAFEGPLDLLLDLIERRKLHIHDISLSEVADDYLSYIETLGEFPTKDAAHFLVIASTLVLIKSRSLLPGLALTPEEETSIDDLEGRLKLLLRIRELAIPVGARFMKDILWFREGDYRVAPVFSPHTEVNPVNMLCIAKEVLKNLPKKEAIPQVLVRQVLSMEEIMDDLTERIKKALSVSFREFTENGAKDKVKIVIGFLAILELVKRGIVSAKQNERFEDIEIEGMEVGVPRYY